MFESSHVWGHLMNCFLRPLPQFSLVSLSVEYSEHVGRGPRNLKVKCAIQSEDGKRVKSGLLYIHLGQPYLHLESMWKSGWWQVQGKIRSKPKITYEWQQSPTRIYTVRIGSRPSFGGTRYNLNPLFHYSGLRALCCLVASEFVLLARPAVDLYDFGGLCIVCALAPVHNGLYSHRYTRPHPTRWITPIAAPKRMIRQNAIMTSASVSPENEKIVSPSPLVRMHIS